MSIPVPRCACACARPRCGASISASANALTRAKRRRKETVRMDVSILRVDSNERARDKRARSAALQLTREKIDDENTGSDADGRTKFRRLSAGEELLFLTVRAGLITRGGQKRPASKRRPEGPRRAQTLRAPEPHCSVKLSTNSVSTGRAASNARTGNHVASLVVIRVLVRVAVVRVHDQTPTRFDLKLIRDALDAAHPFG